MTDIPVTALWYREMINVFAAQPRKLLQYCWALSLASGAVGTLPSLVQPLKVWLLSGTKWWVWDHQSVWCRLSKTHGGGQSTISSWVFTTGLGKITLLTSSITEYWHSDTEYQSLCQQSCSVLTCSFIESRDELFSGESTAARFDLGKDCVICVPFFGQQLSPHKRRRRESPSKPAKIRQCCPRTLRTH